MKLTNFIRGVNEATIRLRGFGPGSADPGLKDRLDKFVEEFVSISQQNPFGRNRLLDGVKIELSIFDGHIHINDIISDDPRTGAGTRALNRLQRLADKYQVRLGGTADAYLGKQKKFPGDPDRIRSTKLLARWYQNNEFRVESNGDGTYEIEYRPASPQTLGEGRSEPVLFHWNEIDRIADMLENGAIQCGVANASDAKHKSQRDYPYYLSTARTANGNYARGHDWGCQIELDRNWLTQRYRVVPMDYWEGTGNSTNAEFEDRVLSRQPTIPIPEPTSRLIRAVHLLLPKPNTAREWGMERFRRMILLCHRLHVPTHVYTDPQAFYGANPAGAVPLSRVRDLLRVNRENPPEYFHRTRRKYLSRYKEMIFKTDRAALSKDAEGRVRALRSGMNDFLHSFTADLHNARSSDREEAYSMIPALQSIGVRTPEEFQSAMRKKWYPEFKW